ncbi:hypothetical protein AKJ09_11461 [Labilithrix luteola]|uniref:Uncharacterized protein n=1 Tax=Labilithrix luteola TaxID=1391654 RepID=A0A0K1QGF2_9BACT|nr:hypothetical protein [Labilithrix luteola]AKV04798.1 hypothetical protein AKJ09_11461 [Labilithrix luteola]
MLRTREEEKLTLVGSPSVSLRLFETLVGTASTGLGELTGTGAGTLYGFLRAGNRIVRLDKKTGSILETYRPDVEIGSGWAFAHWGGDFWLFTAPRNARTTVSRYSPATNTTTVMIEDTGMLIVGAGSSTCAPSAPPARSLPA